MGTPHFSLPALKAIHENFDLVGVFTQPDKEVGRGRKVQFPPVKNQALDFDVPVFQPEKMKEPSAMDALRGLKPDCIVVAAYGQILKQEVLDLPSLGCINIHSSLLPRWRGAAPINWAILEGDLESGVTTMHMALKLDAGDILMTEVTPIGPEETAGELHDRLAEMGAPLIVQTLKRLEKGDLKGTPQNEVKVTYASKLSKDMQWLDPNSSVQELHRKVRALYPWPGSRLKLENLGVIKVHQVRLHPNLKVEPQRLQEKNGMLLVGGCGPQGALEVVSLQLEGKKVCSAQDFFNGLKGQGVSLPDQVVSHES